MATIKEKITQNFYPSEVGDIVRFKWQYNFHLSKLIFDGVADDHLLYVFLHELEKMKLVIEEEIKNKSKLLEEL